ncbi:DNA excision repair protein ERCC-6-like [Ornithodoros turicata]
MQWRKNKSELVGGCNPGSPCIRFDVGNFQAGNLERSIAILLKTIAKFLTSTSATDNKPIFVSKMSSSSGGTTDSERDVLFKKFKKEGREHLMHGQLKEALECYKRAHGLKADSKLRDKINKMEQFLQSGADDEEEAGDMVEVGNGFYLYVGIEKRLYAYQKESLLWMWKLFLRKRGGVLGDDMGLGKTIQVIAFLSGMYDAELIRCVLLIMPVSLMPNWKKEFQSWAPGIKVYDYHTGSRQERERNLARAQKKGGVLITSYGMLQHNSELLGIHNGRQFTWCYLVLDEGHKIKNPTKTTKAVYEIPAKNRLVLTGTAIQNNLRELWALFNFTHQGTLLGSLSTFKVQYETPVNRAREKDATAGERRLGIEIAQALRKKIAPFFLRRTKADVLENKENGDTKSLVPKLVFTAKKNDLVVWTFLSHLQKKIYTEFLESDEVERILMTRKSPLVQLTVLKKICDHPRLLSKRACVQLGMHEDMTQEEIEEFIDNDEGAAMDIASVSDETLLEESGKMMFVLHLLLELKRTGHRTLFFSQSRKILDIMQRILVNRAFRVTRLDGTVTKMIERDRLVSQFQERAFHEVFLLTTQVGGVGLTLTAADRVVIYDPSWNPATDAQAVDRAYRIGQTRNVVVYRLVTCSTVEEKIYRRQIFKDSIIKQTTGKQRDPTRYFTRQELRELFTLEDPTYSNTQVQLEDMHTHNRRTDEGLESHIKFLQRNNIFGVSHHDLMFSEEEQEPEEFVPGELEGVQRRLQEAERLMAVETEMLLSEIQKAEDYTVPMNITVRNREPGQSVPKSPNLFPIIVPDDDDDIADVPERKDVKPVLIPVPCTTIEESIDLDGVDPVKKTLGNLTVKGANRNDSIVLYGSDDELFPDDDAPPTYVIDDSSDGEDTRDIKPVIKRETATQGVPMTLELADDDKRGVIKQEPMVPVAVKSEPLSQHPDVPLQEAVPVAIKEEVVSSVKEEPGVGGADLVPTKVEGLENASPFCTPDTKPSEKLGGSPVCSQDSSTYCTPLTTSPQRTTPLKETLTDVKRPFSFCGAETSPFQEPEERKPPEPAVILEDEDDDEEEEEEENSPLVHAGRRRWHKRVYSSEDEGSGTELASDDGSEGCMSATPRNGTWHSVSSSDNESNSEDEMISQDEDDAWESISQSLPSTQ